MSTPKYLLDANVWSRVFRKRHLIVRLRFAQTAPEEIALCSVVRWELEFGFLAGNYAPEEIENQRSLLARYVSLPFDDSSAKIGAQVRQHLASTGQSIQTADIQIAAIALANDLVLVTHNVKHFSRIPGLKWEDWEV